MAPVGEFVTSEIGVAIVATLVFGPVPTAGVVGATGVKTGVGTGVETAVESEAETGVGTGVESGVETIGVGVMGVTMGGGLEVTTGVESGVDTRVEGATTGVRSVEVGGVTMGGVVGSEVAASVGDVVIIDEMLRVQRSVT